LYEVDIRYIDDLAWAWGELIVDATGEPFDRIRYLVTDAAAAIKKINENREYLAGADRNTNKILTDLGIRDDVGLANADEEKLGDKLGSRGFAVRLIQQARRIVSADSWSLDGLGLSTEQVEALAERGIDSKGALAAGAGRADGRTAIAEALGIDGEPAASRDTAITALANDAVLVMARSSLALAPLATLATWERVDSLTAARLTAAGFATVEDLAAADPDEVATAANVSFAAAKKLVADAGGASRASLAIGALAPVSRAEEKSLKDLLGATRATVGTIASKTPDEIAAAFDGDVARATAVLNGIRAGLAAGRIR
jgi:hypothetical protein